MIKDVEEIFKDELLLGWGPHIMCRNESSTISEEDNIVCKGNKVKSVYPKLFNVVRT